MTADELRQASGDSHLDHAWPCSGSYIGSHHPAMKGTWTCTCSVAGKDDVALAEQYNAELVRRLKAEAEVARLTKAILNLADEWGAENSDEWHHLFNPHVSKAIDSAKYAIVEDLRGLLLGTTP